MDIGRNRRLTPPMRRAPVWISLAAMLALGACASKPKDVTPDAPPVAVPDDTVEILSFDAMAGWEEAAHGALIAEMAPACEKISDRAADESMGGQRIDGAPLYGTRADWVSLCVAAAATRNADAREFFEEWFVPVSIGGAGTGNALFTGYFEPELNGAREPGGPYAYPIYARPSDLFPGEAYYTRAEIDNGALAGRGLELFWLDDPVDVFFLEIQGSGRVRLPDGSATRVGYADKNGHSYTAIGRTLVDWGEMPLDEVSAGSIKAWIAANPARRQALFQTNESYVFFVERPELDASRGPIGAFGLSIPERLSVAIDPSIYVLGSPVWVAFEAPDGPVAALTLALDTGGAIKGPRRVDFFYGAGDVAGDVAGETKARGVAIALVPRAAHDRIFGAGT